MSEKAQLRQIDADGGMLLRYALAMLGSTLRRGAAKRHQRLELGEAGDVAHALVLDCNSMSNFSASTTARRWLSEVIHAEPS